MGDRVQKFEEKEGRRLGNIRKYRPVKKVIAVLGRSPTASHPPAELDFQDTKRLCRMGLKRF